MAGRIVELDPGAAAGGGRLRPRSLFPAVIGGIQAAVPLIQDARYVGSALYDAAAAVGSGAQYLYNALPSFAGT